MNSQNQKNKKRHFKAEHLTLDDIADILKISQPRVRQILNNAMNKMERELRRMKLEEEDI